MFAWFDNPGLNGFGNLCWLVAIAGGLWALVRPRLAGVAARLPRFGHRGARRRALGRLHTLRDDQRHPGRLVAALALHAAVPVFLAGALILHDAMGTGERLALLRGHPPDDIAISLLTTGLLKLALATALMLVPIAIVDRLRDRADPAARRRLVIRHYLARRRHRRLPGR